MASTKYTWEAEVEQRLLIFQYRIDITYIVGLWYKTDTISDSSHS